jgi:amino acid permease
VPIARFQRWQGATALHRRHLGLSNALDSLQIVRGRNSSYCDSKYRSSLLCGFTKEMKFIRNLFAKKNVNDLLSEAGAEHGLRRELGPWNLVTLGVGAIIGAGIFVITGQVAAQFAGPAIVISFVLAGITCAFAGLCYAEFASMIPLAGSAYTYSYATLGEVIAWIIGWDLILEYAFGAATVAVSWSGHLRAFLRDLGIHLPIMPEFTFTCFRTVLHGCN